MLTHINDKGNAVMVDVTEKKATHRLARAGGRIYMSADALKAVTDSTVPKGDVFAAARIAGIMAAKKTPDLIPLCHVLMLTSVEIELGANMEMCCVECECTVKLDGKTGAEMEALTGVSAALLTVYDMCKAIDKNMTISDICLLEKDGGKSGHFERNNNEK